MTTSRPTTMLAGLAAVLVIALLAGCGGSSGSSTPSTPRTTSGQAATLGVGSTGLGKVLVDSQARTLYLFKGDSGTMSRCTGACAADWPPLRAAGKPALGNGLQRSLVATSPRADGAAQLTYQGHPLYLYEGDAKPGDTNGQGVTAFGAGWYALSPAGSQISGTAGSSQPGSSSGGSSYY
jgi:predicted lipoprotein with Yx(FWY)xxD motif